MGAHAGIGAWSVERGGDERACARHSGRRACQWESWALGVLDGDRLDSGETPLIQVRLPAARGVDIYLKDESAHITGSLKHRLARSLLLYGICNGRIGPATPVVEASSGSTAVSVAYFATAKRIAPRHTRPRPAQSRFLRACRPRPI